MKKVIALALAMMLALSMVSMAITANVPNAGGSVVGSREENTWGEMDGQAYPGNAYHFYLDSGVAPFDDLTFNSKNWSVTNDVDKGTADVASVTIKDSCKVKGVSHLVVKFKENFTFTDLKEISGSIFLTAKTNGTAGTTTKNTKYEIPFSALAHSGNILYVANDLEEIDGADNKADATEIETRNNTIYKMNTAGWVSFSGENRFASFKVRLPEGKRIFAYFNEDPIEAIEDKYYELDADIAYYNFIGKPNLGAKAEVALQGDFSDKYFVYEYNNGKLVEVKDAKWNSDDGVYEFKTTQLTSYVISNKELKADAADTKTETTDKDTTTKNPDTGANDVVGVAVALAVVSLVAAGAVSLKK